MYIMENIGAHRVRHITTPGDIPESAAWSWQRLAWLARSAAAFTWSFAMSFAIRPYAPSDHDWVLQCEVELQVHGGGIPDTRLPGQPNSRD